MSFVSIIAREDFISIMSDGRVCGPNGIPIQEDYQKFVRVDERFFVAFAGHKEPCELFLRNSGLLSPRTYDVELFSAEIQSKLIAGPSRKHKILLALGGFNHHEEIVFSTFSTIQPKMQLFRPKGDDISYAFLNNSSVRSAQLEELLIEALKVSGFQTPDQIREGQTQLNSAVSAMDESVNSTVFNAVINRPARN